ncbi:MAG: nucleoside hydrolase [Methylotenera sp.]|nr:nucleoside hydrolase [Oligoflexia bacterium]
MIARFVFLFLLSGFIFSFTGWTNLVRAEDAQATGKQVWIDTDISTGLAFKDVDDGYALTHALKHYPDAVAGISVTYGNAPTLARPLKIAAKVLALNGQSQESIPLYSGATSPTDFDSAGSRALAEFLRQRSANAPIAVLALGRLTTIAGAFRLYPEGVSKVSEVIFVGGRRLDYEPRVGKRQFVLTDSNYWGDEASFDELLGHGLHFALISTEVALHFEITPADLRLLSQSGGASAWLARHSKLWLRIWRLGLRENGFLPFDLLASVYFNSPEKMTCDDQLGLRILSLPDFSFGKRGKKNRNHPVVSENFSESRGLIRYCHSAGPAFHDQVLEELL